MLQSKQPTLVKRNALAAGTRIWVYFNTSKQNDPVRWIPATVVEAGKHLVKCRRSKKGPPISVAYTHIRVAPDGELAKEMIEGTSEGVMASDMDVEAPGDLPIEVWRDIFGESEEAERDAEALRVSSMLSSTAAGNPTKDIGTDTERGPSLE